jgi:hypothetical protein
MGFLNPKSKEEKNKNWGLEQILTRGAWPLSAGFLILTLYTKTRKPGTDGSGCRRPAAPRTRDPRRTGSLTARSLARESASRSLVQEGGVAAARRKGTGTQKACRIDAKSYAWFSSYPMGHRQNTTTTYTFGVGPPGLEGPVRRPSSNPPGPGLTQDFTMLTY